MKNFLKWSARSTIIVLSLEIAIGLALSFSDQTQAQSVNLTTTLTNTTEIIPYTIPLSLTTVTVYVSDGFTLNIRNGPSRRQDTRAALVQNDPVIIEGTNSSDCLWVYVTKPRSKFGGWVHSEYLRNSRGTLVSEECPPTRVPLLTPTSLVTLVTDQNERSNETLLERYRMLAIGIIALLLTALLYWIAYTKGFLSRLRQTESSVSISANSKIPKAGTPYLEAMLISAQPIYCPLDDKNISIGRDEGNTLVIDSRFAQWDTVSSRHARIEQDGDSFIIIDLDSKNGVFVDGRRTQENILYDGMQVSLGKVVFIFRINER